MNKAKALLDSLMGPSRNQASNEKSGTEFTGANVCKHHLVGCCPDSFLGKKLEATRTEFDRPSVVAVGCSKLHSVAMKAEFQQHKDHDKYRREYEDSLMKHLEAIIREADGKAVYERKKREDMQIPWAFHEKLCDLCGLKYKLDKKDGMLGSGLGEDCYKDDRHPETDVHKIYVKLRRKLEELKEKAKADGRHEDAKRGSSRERHRAEKDGVDQAGRGREQSRTGTPVNGEKAGKEGKDAEYREERKASGSRSKVASRADVREPSKPADKKDGQRPSSRARDQRGGSKDRRRSKSARRSRSRKGSRGRSNDRKRSRSKEAKRSGSKDRKRSASKDRKRSASRDRKRSGSRDRKRSRSREGKRGKSKDRKRSRSREGKRDKSRERKSSPSRSKDRRKSRDASGEGKRSRGKAEDQKRDRSRSRASKRSRSKAKDRSRSASGKKRGKEDREKDKKTKEKDKQKDKKEKEKSKEKEKEKTRESEKKDKSKEKAKDKKKSEKEKEKVKKKSKDSSSESARSRSRGSSS